MTRATVDEHDIVSVYDASGQLRFFAHRSTIEQVAKSLGCELPELEPVVSGGGIVYGLERRKP